MRRYERFYAGGRFLPCGGAMRWPVVDPHTEEMAGEVQGCTGDDLAEALAAARAAQPGWQASTPAERRAALLQLRELLGAQRERFAAELAGEIGCPVFLGRGMQMDMALRGLELAAEGVEQVAWRETVGNGVVERVPAGVVAAITPWNFPLHQIVAKVAAALAAGCTVVLKPSEVAPGAAWLFAEAVHASVLPAGVFNLVWGDAALGQALVTAREVDHVSFTGSTAVGRAILAQTAAGLKPATLELGGKSAAVLLDDADLAQALPVVARMALVNSGQACVSQSRVLVPRPRLAQAREALAAAFAGWQPGAPQAESTRLGPVATQRQWMHVRQHVASALDQGARAVVGGPQRPAGCDRGWYVAPTLLDGVEPWMAVAQQEVFGPVLALLAYDDEEQAVQIANGTDYGLSGAVWSADLRRAEDFARRLRTGQVILNGAAQNLATPFGGWGASGFGRENGRFGIEDLLRYRALHGAA